MEPKDPLHGGDKIEDQSHPINADREDGTEDWYEPESPDETVVTDESSYAVQHHRARRVYGGMWGTAELVAVGASLLALLSVIAVYLLFVVPERRNLESNRQRRDVLEDQLKEAQRKFGDITETETQVVKLITSVEDFEARFLQEESRGRTAVYQRLNGLINAFGLVNSAGPDYTPLELSEEERRQNSNDSSQRGRSKFQSLFPGIYVTMTVEGPYQNLRRFINEIENSSEFLLVSAIELEPAESDGSSAAGQSIASTAAAGRTRGKVVGLRLELAGYFQRANEERLRTTLSVPETIPGVVPGNGLAPNR